MITGALGCIGAWTVATLVREGVAVVAFDLSEDDRRLRLVATPEELDRVTVVRGDVTDLACVERALAEHGVTHVVHLAALQVPFCKADPVLGARVNVLGTVTVFEAAKRHGLRTPVAYASSAAVYDEDGRLEPRTLYGVYKIANEGTARVCWRDDGVASVGLRPFSVYGPGRDQGLTASPTLAMAAAVRGEPFRIAFGGSTQYHYAPDVARAFIQAARSEPSGAGVFNLGGDVVPMERMATAIRAALPAAEISYEADPLPFPDRLPEPWFEWLQTPLEEGVRETIELLRAGAGQS